GLGNDMEVQLRTLELPVDYREAKRRVTGIWEDHRPQLALHMGWTPLPRIILEQSSKNRDCWDADIWGFWPEGSVCLPGGPDVPESGVCMKAVHEGAVEGVEAIFSPDAGSYALWGCAALINVPPLSRRLPASLLGRALSVGKPRRKAWFKENSTVVVLAKGN
uniref:Uncharacterized protein n=1 Tax=Saimiri boliviensis boliviensis TaxID=39432 RepID=A0A2K6ULD6_SAIBB